MGATESTARSNGTTEEEEEEEEQVRGNNRIGGATAIAATAGVAVAAAWGLSRMLSNNTQETLTQLPIPPHQGSTQPSTRSPRGRYKMNTDGGCHPRSGRPEEYVGNTRVQRGPSGYGGILRDHTNNWVGGFMGFIGESDSLTSEFHGILKGLEVLDKLNIRGIILETDCQPAYQFVKEQRGPEYLGKSQIVFENWPRILKSRRLADENDIKIKLISRNENKYADKLANMAIEREEDEYVELKEIPDELIVIALARRTT